MARGAMTNTQYHVLLECTRATERGFNYVPTGADFKRAKALVRRGLLEPVHGRKGEGEEWFRLSAYGRSVMGAGKPAAHLPEDCQQ